MIIENQEVIKDVGEFQIVFDRYFKHFVEYFSAKLNPKSIFQIAHQDLIYDSICLQASFLKLPDILKKRLYYLDFELFLHCDNVVDLYSLREYLLKPGKYEQFATIIERIDSEIKLAKEIIDRDVLDKYKELPNKNFDFYRDEKSVSLLERLYRDDPSTPKKENETSNSIETKEVAEQDEYSKAVQSKPNLLDNYNEFMEKSGKSIEATEKVFSKGITFIGVVSKLLNFLK